MRERRVVSLFSGCGGLDLGLEGAFETLEESINTSMNGDWIYETTRVGFVSLKPTGLKTVFANDINVHAAAAWRRYFCKRGTPSNTFHVGSIVDLIKDAKKNGSNPFPEADIVTGGFPCQDFSVAGKRKGFRSDKSHKGGWLNLATEEPTIENRGVLYLWMREAIEIIKPKIFIAENVKGLVNLLGVKEVIERDFRNIGPSGYVVKARVLNAGEYGIPQKRERVIFIGFRRDALRSDALRALENEEQPHAYDPYPTPSHRASTGVLPGLDLLLPPVTCRIALRGLREPCDETTDHSQMQYSKAKFMGKHCQGQTEIEIDGLGPTVRAEHHGNIEFRRLSREHGGKILDEIERGLPERRLTVRECARIQTFPDDYEFVFTDERISVSASSAYKLVGNAVPPLLAYHLGMRIQKLWSTWFEEE